MSEFDISVPTTSIFRHPKNDVYVDEGQFHGPLCLTVTCLCLECRLADYFPGDDFRRRFHYRIFFCLA